MDYAQRFVCNTLEAGELYAFNPKTGFAVKGVIYFREERISRVRNKFSASCLVLCGLSATSCVRRPVYRGVFTVYKLKPQKSHSSVAHYINIMTVMNIGEQQENQQVINCTQCFMYTINR